MSLPGGAASRHMQCSKHAAPLTPPSGLVSMPEVEWKRYTCGYAGNVGRKPLDGGPGCRARLDAASINTGVCEFTNVCIRRDYILAAVIGGRTVYLKTTLAPADKPINQQLGVNQIADFGHLGDCPIVPKLVSCCKTRTVAEHLGRWCFAHELIRFDS